MENNWWVLFYFTYSSGILKTYKTLKILKDFSNIGESSFSPIKSPKVTSTDYFCGHSSIFAHLEDDTFPFAACKWTEIQNKGCDVKCHRGRREVSELSSQKQETIPRLFYYSFVPTWYLYFWDFRQCRERKKPQENCHPADNAFH